MASDFTLNSDLQLDLEGQAKSTLRGPEFDSQDWMNFKEGDKSRVEDKEERVKVRLLRQRGRRKPRVIFSCNQVEELERTFDNQKYLTPEERKELSERLKLTQQQVF